MDLLLRSMLFVPTNNVDYILKAVKSAADAIILDLEDAISAPFKDEARSRMVEAIDDGLFSAQTVFIRVNAPSTGLLSADVEAGMHDDVYGFLCPKVETPADVFAFDKAIAEAERLHGYPAGRFKIALLIETAAGILHLGEMLSESNRIVAAGFGAYDFRLSMGIMSETAKAFRYMPRAILAMQARSAGVLPIDTPYFAVKDIDGLRADKREAFELGFAGSMVITPAHIDVVNKCFTPDAQTIKYANGVLDSINEAKRSHAGVALYDGMMIDEPIRIMAEQTLEFMRTVEKKESFNGI
jgi:citrate lyase subunit beta/citryl-CoA lyase